MNIKLILRNVQIRTTCHQKYLKEMESYYKQLPSEEYVREVSRYLRFMFFGGEPNEKNPFTRRGLEFLAKFVALMAESKSEAQSKENSFSQDVSYSNNCAELSQIIDGVLNYHDSINYHIRYAVCLFLAFLLQHLSGNYNLDNDICDSIQDAMLERVQEQRYAIRKQAVATLIRLQDPCNPECLVIKAYVSLLKDVNASIRKEVVQSIAVLPHTLARIVDRADDVDEGVREAAMLRLAGIDPQYLKIDARQKLVSVGLWDTAGRPKKAFVQKVLPKWRDAYQNNFLRFLTALKLDADEKDISDSQQLIEKLIDEILSLKKYKMEELMENLPLDENSLIPPDQLSLEASVCWKKFTSYARLDVDNDFVEGKSIVPELSVFSDYVESFVHSKSPAELKEHWQLLDQQYVLANLFDIARGYDRSDEIGRKRFLKLTRDLLQDPKVKLMPKLAGRLVGVLSELVPDVEALTMEICEIISEIREPLSGSCSSVQESGAENWAEADGGAHRESVCRWLDVLIGLLSVPNVSEMSAPLEMFRTKSIEPLLAGSDDGELQWRLMRCMTLFSLKDRALAEKYFKPLSVHLANYRFSSHDPDSKRCLKESVGAVCDLLRWHDLDLCRSVRTLARHSTRRLYENDAPNLTVTAQHVEPLTVNKIVDILLDMLDDEDPEIQDAAVTGVMNLLFKPGFPMDPHFISRILVRAHNPFQDSKFDPIAQKLLYFVTQYGGRSESKEAVVTAVVPALVAIANSPAKNDPLQEEMVCNLMRLLASVCDSDGSQGAHMHALLAGEILNHLNRSRLQDLIVFPYLLKMLVLLDVREAPADSLREMGKVIQDIEEKAFLDKGSLKMLSKFGAQLKFLDGKDGAADPDNEEQSPNIIESSQTGSDLPLAKITEMDGEEGRSLSFSLKELRVVLTNTVVEDESIVHRCKRSEKRKDEVSAEGNNAAPSSSVGSKKRRSSRRITSTSSLG